MKIKYIISIKKVLLCMFLLLIFTSIASAQTKKNAKVFFVGSVTDTFGSPIAGAEVRLQNSDKMAVTNINGKFELNVYDTEAVLEVSHEGFKTSTITKGAEMSLDIQLQKDASNRDRVISMVYESRPEYSIGAAVTTISGEELNRTPYINLAAALVGRLPGLMTRVTNAEPGSEDYTLNIRGIGTSNGRSALVLIDGVKSNNLQEINPRDVASVTIYKDGASNILYGMQAGNGIISVVTRSGDFGKPRIRVTADHSFQQPLNTPDMLNSWEYASLRNQAYANDNPTTAPNHFYSDSQIANYRKNFQSGDSAGLFPNNNWYKTFMQPMVKTQRYNLSSTGGIDGLKYYTNVGYSNVGSPYKTDGGTPQSIDRIDFRTNVDVKLNNYLDAFMKISGLVRRTTGSRIGSSTILSSLFNLPPTMYGPLTPERQVIATDQETEPTYGRINSSGNIKQTTTKMNTILGLNVNLGFITEGLSVKTMAMLDATANSNVNGTTTYERWIRNEARQDSLRFIKQGAQLNTPLTLSKNSTTSYMSNVNGLLAYDKKFDLHAIGAMTFIRYQRENHADLNINGILPYQRLTYGGRLNYGYSNLVFAELAASYEGSEQFSPDRRFGLFPAGSLAWVVSNHDFLKDNKTITYLKLRGSYGIVGNDQFGAERFLYLDNIAKSGSSFVGSLFTPVDETQKGNPLLTWEKSHKANIGFELGLWNQITFGLDLFDENRTDILVTRNSVPASQGVPTANLAMANLGVISNKGFEVQLGYSKIFSKDFSVNVTSYLDYNINKTIESDEISLGSDYAYEYRAKGYSMGQNFGYIVDKSNGNGYFNSAAEILNSGLTYEGKAPRPGDFIYKDLNGDKIINAKDQAPMGYSSIPQISWGVNLHLEWKNFDASILMQGVGRVSQFNGGMGFYDYINGGTYFDTHRNAWTPDRYAKGELITAPALATVQSTSNRSNDYYLTDKSFTRLKNVEIGYQIPYNVAKVIKTESVRIYVSGNNLLTFDKMNNKDIDVEMGSYTAFPTNRTWNVGLNVTF